MHRQLQLAGVLAGRQVIAHTWGAGHWRHQSWSLDYRGLQLLVVEHFRSAIKNTLGVLKTRLSCPKQPQRVREDGWVREDDPRAKDFRRTDQVEHATVAVQDQTDTRLTCIKRHDLH
jgi:hypothetical protein